MLHEFNFPFSVSAGFVFGRTKNFVVSISIIINNVIKKLQRNSFTNHAAKVGIFYDYRKKTNKILTTIKLVFFCTKVCTGVCTNL
jgi:hypothetical protein